MTSKMLDELKEFISGVKSKKGLESLSEADTKQAIILPLLHILGWDIFNLEEIKPEYRIDSYEIDYVLSPNTENKVFTEAKGSYIRLEEKEEEQLLKYAFRKVVHLAILTNGIQWMFYLPREEVDWNERKFCTLDIKNGKTDALAQNFIDFLSRDNVVNGKAVEKAKNTNKLKQEQTNAVVKNVIVKSTGDDYPFETRGSPKKRKNFRYWYESRQKILTIHRKPDSDPEKYNRSPDLLTLDELAKIINLLENQFGLEWFPLANNVKKLSNGTEKKGFGTTMLSIKPGNTKYAQASSYLGVVFENLGLLTWNSANKNIKWRLLRRGVSQEEIEGRIKTNAQA